MILVVGGTGMLGRCLVRRLLDRQAEVRVLTRITHGTSRSPGSRRCPATSATRRRSWTRWRGRRGRRGRPRCAGTASPVTIDGEGNAHLIDVAGDVGTDVVLVSVVGGAPDHPLELFRMKFAAEEHLRRSGVPGTVVRATVFAELWIRFPGLPSTTVRDLLRQPPAAAAAGYTVAAF